MSKFAPPPFPFVIIPLPKHNYGVAVLQRKFVSVLRFIIKNRVYLAVIHDSQFFLDACVSNRFFLTNTSFVVIIDFKFRSDNTDCISTPNIRRILPRPLRTFPRRSRDPKGWLRKCKHHVRPKISP